jgi:4-alpha-glucanotransferase
MPSTPLPEDHRRLVSAALEALEVHNLVLSIHDPSYPSDPDEDTGRGSPYTRGATRFLAFVRELGFTGIQFGPQGQTTEYNPSPYDGTLFSRNVLNVALGDLADPERWGALLTPERVAAVVAGRPSGPHPGERYRYVFRAVHAALHEAWNTFRLGREQGGAPGLKEVARRFAAFQREHHAWVERDARFEALATLHGHMDWRRWPEGPDTVPDAEHRALMERYAFLQLLVHTQHRELRARVAGLGLKLYGDLQIGLSPRDAWAWQGLFLRGYLMGAPPSRTNPEGQPWNYPVLDPERYFAPEPDAAAPRAPGPVLRFMELRMDKMLAEYDGLRIDHPHGLIDPWVYRAEDPDSLRAVQGGARLFGSPDLPDHPALARFARVRPEQLDRGLPRHADGWVRELTPEQVRDYSVLFDTVIASARRRGRELGDVLCEVLSTQPYPIRRVMEQYGLGRFRVTQKANLADPTDAYRGENATPEDWVMVGNHDTRPIWRVADEWRQAGTLPAQAAYLAWRLHPASEGRDAFARQLAEAPGLLVQAKFADLFATRARHVMVFFADLLGMRETYNVPGTFNEQNWSLRVPADYGRDYREKLGRDAALNLPRVLALALRARGAEAAGHRDLIAGLERLAGELRAPA